ncbi:MAG: hypothetical protein Fur0018_24360 [Anaerolineales bacterium]
MTDHTTTQQTRLSLAQQVDILRSAALQIHRTLQSSASTIPRTLIEQTDQLTKNLAQIQKQVAHKEEDYTNLLALADIGQVINSSLDPNAVLRIVMDTIIRLTNAERGFLMLRNQSGELSIRIARNWEKESIDSSEFAISRTVVERVAADGQPLLTTNAQEDPRFDGHQSIIAYNLRSILCVPLKVKGELIGVIYADNRIRTGIFTESDRDLLSAFANQAAVAIENARLFESLRQTLDEVTELKNLMDNVFASIASGVLTADIEERITLCNRSAELILGKSAGDVIGHSLHDVVLPIKERIADYVQAVRQEDTSVVGVEIDPELPDKGRVILNVNLSPLKDADQHTQGITIVLDDLTERKRLEAERRLFERMVSPAVIAQLNPDQLQLGGKRTNITTLFADIRGFTSFSESLAPEQLFNVLNRYLAAAADAVLTHEGTVDKFMGDAVMSWFNAPIPQEDHALRAVRTALGIRDSIRALHEQLPPEFRLAFGVGIHYGEALLGLVGTEKRLEYTAIGDSVNTAKRIQENSAANQILISEQVYQLIADQISVREVEPVRAKGKSVPLRVYEVLGLR